MKAVWVILALAMTPACAMQKVNHGMLCLGICFDWLEERRTLIEAGLESEFQCLAPPTQENGDESE